MATVVLATAVAILLGTALGLFGGGGGILAVPMLVGLLGMDVDQAATASLVIVAFGALGGLVSHHRAGRVLWRSGLLFGLVSAGGAVAGAALATRVPDSIKFAAFFLLMVTAGLAMLRNARRQPSASPAARHTLVALGGGNHVGAQGVGMGVGMGLGPGDDDAEPGAVMIDAPAVCLPMAPHVPTAPMSVSIPLVILLATTTGLVTGFLGVGGGFLVVPALVLSLRMPMANATATGLVVIAIASVSALVMRLAHAQVLTDPGLVALIVAVTVGASLVAARFSGRLSPRAMGTGFAILVLGMSLLVVSQAVQNQPGA